MITLKVKLNLLNQAWYDDDGTGKKFITLTVWKKDEQDQYGNDYSVRQNVPREERDAMKARNENIPFVGDGRMYNAVHKSQCIEVILERDKIDKESLYKGEKHLFLDCALTHVPAAEQGATDADYYCWQTPSKAERLRGKKGTRIGIGFRKEVRQKAIPEGDWSESYERKPQAAPLASAPVAAAPGVDAGSMSDDDIPF